MNMVSTFNLDIDDNQNAPVKLFTGNIMLVYTKTLHKVVVWVLPNWFLVKMLCSPQPHPVICGRITDLHLFGMKTKIIYTLFPLKNEL